MFRLIPESAPIYIALSPGGIPSKKTLELAFVPDTTSTWQLLALEFPRIFPNGPSPSAAP